MTRLTPTERQAIIYRANFPVMSDSDVILTFDAIRKDSRRLLSDLDAADAEVERLRAELARREHDAIYWRSCRDRINKELNELKAALPQGDGT